MAVGGRELGATPTICVADSGAHQTVGIDTVKYLRLALSVPPGGVDLGGVELGYPIEVLIGQADMEVGAGRAGHLLGEERPQGAAVDPTEDLAEQPALGHRVVGGHCPGLPPGFLGGQAGAHVVPVEQLVLADWRVEPGEAGRVGEKVAYQNPLLTVGRELGPVVGHRLIDVEGVSVVEHE